MGTFTLMEMDINRARAALPYFVPVSGGGDSRHPPVLSGRAEAPRGVPRNEYEQAVLSGRAEAPRGVPRNEYEQAIRDHAPGDRHECQPPGNAGPGLAIERNGHFYANGNGQQQGAGGAPLFSPLFCPQ